MRIKLKNIKTDPDLVALRPINLFTVSRYRQAYRTGSKFPDILIDKATNLIVSGNHRYSAMKEEFGDDHIINAIVRSYSDRGARLLDFVTENGDHGLPFSGFSRRLIAIEMLKENISAEEVAKRFNVSVRRIEQWGECTVMVVGEDQDTSVKIRKIGPQMKEVITQKEYAQHVRRDLGILPEQLVDQLIEWLSHGWIKKTPEIEIQFKQLQILIDGFLQKQAVAQN